MKMLLLGGPRFLGYALVDSALAHGHEVTMFNRGRTFPDRFPAVERITGDRDSDLGELADRSWDAVVDTCGYFPHSVRASTQALADSVGHYTFVSSISVYDIEGTVGPDENTPVLITEDVSATEITGENYGPLKALCEQAVEETFPGRALNVRPGLIVGPHDPTDRFTYWPVRAALGGRILAPGRPESPVQVIDVRDLADWLVRMAEARVSGAVNVTGPVMRMETVLQTCLELASQDAYLEWLPEAFLLEQQVQPWIGLPLWLPRTDSPMMQASIERALALGLAFRPLLETVRDTLKWAHTRPADYEWRAGLKREREAEVLAAWDSENTVA